MTTHGFRGVLQFQVKLTCVVWCGNPECPAILLAQPWHLVGGRSARTPPNRGQRLSPIPAFNHVETLECRVRGHRHRSRDILPFSVPAGREKQASLAERQHHLLATRVGPFAQVPPGPRRPQLSKVRMRSCDLRDDWRHEFAGSQDAIDHFFACY